MEQRNINELYKLAEKFLDMNHRIDAANKIKDYYSVKDIESYQRDIGGEMANIIHELYINKNKISI